LNARLIHLKFQPIAAKFADGLIRNGVCGHYLLRQQAKIFVQRIVSACLTAESAHDIENAGHSNDDGKYFRNRGILTDDADKNGCPAERRGYLRAAV
jgi:hypothetical protein